MHQPPLSELHPQGQSQGVFVLTESTLQSIGAHPVLTQKKPEGVFYMYDIIPFSDNCICII